jgi:hypothetical protein
MAQEKIKLTKKVYDKQSAGDLIDRSFSEVINSKDSISNTNLNSNLNRLFNLYNDLFYDIPKMGKQSHTSLFKQSRDYIGNYVDSKDEEIEGLVDRIIELEEKLDNQNQPDEEHPFYRNGSIIMERNKSWNLYYMEKGTRRKLMGDTSSEVFKDLRAALGFKGDWEDAVTITSADVIAGIPAGPRFGPEDLSGNETNVEAEEAIADEILSGINTNLLSNWKINPNNYNINSSNIPSIYISTYSSTGYIPGYTPYSTTRNSYTTYRNYLKGQIEETWTVEKRLEILSEKYKNDIEYSFTENEQKKAQTLLDSLIPKIRKSQETLVFYKRLWSRVSSGENSLGGNVQEKFIIARDTFESSMNTPITNSERNEYKGWKQGKDNFPNIDLN